MDDEISAILTAGDSAFSWVIGPLFISLNANFLGRGDGPTIVLQEGLWRFCSMQGGGEKAIVVPRKTNTDSRRQFFLNCIFPIERAVGF